MLRRLLSNPLAMNNIINKDEEFYLDEPKEYFVLSKMQPLPPEENDQLQGDLQNYWYQPYQNNNQLENDVYWPNCIPIDQYNNNNNGGINNINTISTPPPPLILSQQQQQSPLLLSPPPQLYCSVTALPPPPLQTEFNNIQPPNILLDEKNIYQNNSNNFIFESTQEGPKDEIDSLRKISNNSFNGTEGGGVGQERNGESPFYDYDNNTNDVFYCSYCNRSFPRYRISPRRHQAQCRRINNIEDFNLNNLNGYNGGGGDGGSSTTTTTSTSFCENNNNFGHKSSTIDFSSLNNKNSKNIKNNNTSNSSSPTPTHGGIGSVDPSDPYQCSWCQFNTLYKGNMKRHLICCHQVSLEILTNLNFNIERLRKLSTSRPLLNELPIQPRKDIKEENNLNNNNDFNLNKFSSCENNKKIKTKSIKRKISSTDKNHQNQQQNNKLIKIEQQQQNKIIPIKTIITTSTSLSTSASINNIKNYSTSTIKFAPYI